MVIKNVFASLLVVGILAACGGGGGGSGGAPAAALPVTSTLAFPLQQAMRDMNAYGNSATYESHGTLATEAANGLCSGTMYSTNSAATTSATFEGAFAYSSTDSTTVTYTNCTPSPTTSGGTDYYDGNYDQVGYIDSSSYRKYGPWTVPATVHVGDAGFLVTEMAYTNSSKTVVQYRRDISYSVAADTASTAIVNIVVRYYFPDYIDSSGTHAVYTQFSTVQSKNRITAGGSLVELSTDTQRLNVNSTAGSSSQHHYVWNMVSNTPGAVTSTPGGTASYVYTGAVQTVSIPVGATSVTVSASGGGGAGGTYTTGGAGGTVNASWSLAALGGPSSLSVYVGGAGVTPSLINTGEGSSGAGGGGGATVVAFGGSQALLIAGGGGGGGAGTDTAAAGGNGCGGNGGGSHAFLTLGGNGGGSSGAGGAGGSQSGVSGGTGGSSSGALGAAGVGGGGGGAGGSSAFSGGAGGTNNFVTGSGGGGGFGGVAGSNSLMTMGGYGGGGAANYGGGGGGGYGGGGAGGYLSSPVYGGGGGGGSTYIRTGLAAASCVAATSGVGVGGFPHANGQNGGVSITFN